MNAPYFELVETVVSMLNRYNFSFTRPMTVKSIVDELISYDDDLKHGYTIYQLLQYQFKQREPEPSFDFINWSDQPLPEWFKKKLFFPK